MGNFFTIVDFLLMIAAFSLFALAAKAAADAVEIGGMRALFARNPPSGVAPHLRRAGIYFGAALLCMTVMMQLLDMELRWLRASQ